MKNHFTRCFDPDEHHPMPTTCTVHEDDPQPTGLLDRWGNPLIRQREPIGFRLRPVTASPPKDAPPCSD